MFQFNFEMVDVISKSPNPDGVVVKLYRVSIEFGIVYHNIN